jgi:acyl-CoA thioesterase-2
VDNIETFLSLERIEENIFRGESHDLHTGQVYGGQVLGQALTAAQLTVEKDRSAHSVHAYFLRKGDVNAPIIYEVDRSRDGRTFGARRVVAIQHGRPIFTLSASFQFPEKGLDFESKMDLPTLPDSASLPSELKDASDSKVGRVSPVQYFDIRKVDGPKGDNALKWWLKVKDPLPNDPSLHRAVMAYLSDFGLLGSALIPHGLIAGHSKDVKLKIAMASIDHAIWYHRAFRTDEWLFYQCEAISTSGARGLSRGSIYSEDGALVATTIQEGLIRPI